MDGIDLISQQIVAAREQSGLRQIDVAAQSGLSRATIDALENGRVGDIGVSKLTRILAAVGLELRIVAASTQRPTLDDLLKDDSEDDRD